MARPAGIDLDSPQTATEIQYETIVQTRFMPKQPLRRFTVSFPEPLAKQVDRLAKQESRNISELMREAFRVYLASKK